MNDHSELLEMIESVDPADTDKLDEIDAKVEHWLYWSRTQIEQIFYQDNIGVARFTTTDGRTINVAGYTRSLDAQERIDTEEWYISVTAYLEGGYCSTLVNTKGFKTEYISLPTEPLARLHAKLQVIEFNRQKEHERIDG